MIFLKTNLKKGSDVMSKKNENINEEVKNAEETAEDIKETETKEEASKETEETTEAAADDKIAELEASVADWKDKYQRLMAEFENARKRTAKEATQRYDMGAMGVLEKLLPVIDNFERGLEAVSEEEKDSAFVKGTDLQTVCRCNGRCGSNTNGCARKRIRCKSSQRSDAYRR